MRARDSAKPTRLAYTSRGRNTMGWRSILSIVFCGALSSAAVAGTQQVIVTTINVTEGWAYSAMGEVRYNDANPNEFISCDIWARGYIFCMAQKNNGETARCHTTEAENPLFAERVRSIDSVSDVTFFYDPNSEVCNSILVNKGTQFLP